MPSRPIGLAQASLLDLHPLEFLRAAAAGGFGGVGLRILPPLHSPVPWQVVGHPALLREIRGVLSDLGLRVLEVEAFTLHPHTRVAEDLEAALDAAAEIGAGQVLTTSTDDQPERFARNFALLCEAAGHRGLAVGLEFMPFRAIRNLAQALALVRASGCPNARVTVDALHLCRSGGTPAEVAALAPRWLGCAQLSDAGAGVPLTTGAMADEARTTRLRPGTGVLPLPEFLRALPPGLPFTVEVPGALPADMPAAQRAALLHRDVVALLARSGGSAES